MRKLKMSKRKEIIKIKTQKPRNFELIELQIKGLMRTRVIRNKKKDVKKFNWKKDCADYLNFMFHRA